ncbi:hypothetical protein ISCGN_003697 [Ixodes scapularis]
MTYRGLEKEKHAEECARRNSLKVIAGCFRVREARIAKTFPQSRAVSDKAHCEAWRKPRNRLRTDNSWEASTVCRRVWIPQITA